MKLLTMISFLALIGCGDDERTPETIETVTVNPVQGNCDYYVTARYYNRWRNVTSCHYAYRCNGRGFKLDYAGNVWCGR